MDHTSLGFYCNGILNICDLNFALRSAQGIGNLWGEDGISERLV